MLPEGGGVNGGRGGPPSGTSFNSSGKPLPGRGPWPAAGALEEDDGRVWHCAKGDHALEPRSVTLSYLVAGFPVKLPTCLEHGLVLITEGLATGRMRQVELALEDK